MGTLIGLSRKARLMDDKGHIENLDKALVTDSVGTVVSSFLGTSTVTSYVESAAGISQGGRTGLTALTVAVLFAASLVFAAHRPCARFRHGSGAAHRGRAHDDGSDEHRLQ